MGIIVDMAGMLPEEPEIRMVVDTAITVHITNIIKHTTGRKAFVRIVEEAEEYVLYLKKRRNV